MSLAAGRLQHRVTLQSQQVTKDPATGYETIGWVTVTKLWAHVEPLSVREFIASEGNEAEVSARITIRYRDGIDQSKRFQHRGKVYNIHGALADNVSGLEYMTLPCSEGVNTGE